MNSIAIKVGDLVWYNEDRHYIGIAVSVVQRSSELPNITVFWVFDGSGRTINRYMNCDLVRVQSS